MIENLPSNAGVVGSVPDQGTKIPPAAGQLSPHTATREAHTWQLLSPHALEPRPCNRRMPEFEKAQVPQ